MQTQNLRVTVTQLAQVFADQVFEALRSMSLDDILDLSHNGAETVKLRTPGRPARAVAVSRPVQERVVADRPSPGGHNGRRSSEDIQEMVDRIVVLLRSHKDGLRAEQIREQLGIDRRELPKPIGIALDQKKIAKQGEKRATTYFVR